jgi:hypothetical protein
VVNVREGAGKKPAVLAARTSHLDASTKCKNKKPVLFIRQTSRSNYCGVYATGMLLSILGLQITRGDALTLFNISRSNASYKGATLDEISTVVAGIAALRRVQWQEEHAFRFSRIAKFLNRFARPTLLSFGIVHKNNVWRCRHVAVVIKASSHSIELLDPLGAPPRGTSVTNVQLVSRMPDFNRVRVIGASYSVNHEAATDILKWNQKRELGPTDLE